MAKLKTIIVDDEDLARRGLRIRLQHHDNLDIVAECKNGREALNAVTDLNPDLVFLDIQMPGIDGFEVVRRMQQDDMPFIVFITAYDQYAIEAFKVHAVDYLLKPPEDKAISRALVKVRQHMQQKIAMSEKNRLLSAISEITGKLPAEMEEWLAIGGKLNGSYPDRISVRDNGRLLMVDIDEIDWIDAAGDYMCLHTNGSVHVMRTTMKQLESQLDPRLFQRIHRSTIINLRRVKEVNPHNNGEFYLTLECGMRLKMSRNYRDKVQLLEQV